MGYNKSLLAFADVREALDRALAAQKGIRIPCSSRGAAIVLRVRFNYFRKMDRKENLETYNSEHPLHGRSPYDCLVLRVPPKGAADEHVLFIEKRSIDDLVIEEIT